MGGIQEVDSADQIGQLEALHFKMKPKKFQFPSSKSGGNFGKWYGKNAKEIPNGETYIKRGGAARKDEIGSIGKHGAFKGSTVFGNSGVGSIIEGRFVYTVWNKPISSGCKKGAYWRESKIRCQILRNRYPRICGRKCIRTDGTITKHPSAIGCNCVPKVEF